MAKQIKLAAQARTGLGRSAVTKLKMQGLVPAVVYGAKQEAEHLQLSAREIDNVLSHATGEHFLVELEVGGAANRLALVQEVQHHPVTRKVLHVDSTRSRRTSCCTRRSSSRRRVKRPA